MVPLPDGTILIVNGAQQGQAGFASATQPNLNAVLYDPSLPIGTRFSILGSTIVPRMYHSEATLLPDGRVIISGSDPQDNRFPEEYRIEVNFQLYFLLSLVTELNYLISGLRSSLPNPRSSTTNFPSSNIRLGLWRLVCN
jgi:hypothetical protein